MKQTKQNVSGLLSGVCRSLMVFLLSQGALMSSSSSLVLPAVSWPASNAVIGQLQDQLDTSPLYMDPETLSQLRLNASSPALLVFRLPYGIGSVDCSIINR